MLVAVVGEPRLRDGFVFGSRCISPSPLFPHSPRRHMVRVIAETGGPQGVLLLASSSVLDGVLWDIQSPEVRVVWESGHHFQADFFVTTLGSHSGHPLWFYTLQRSISQFCDKCQMTCRVHPLICLQHILFVRSVAFNLLILAAIVLK